MQWVVVLTLLTSLALAETKLYGQFHTSASMTRQNGVSTRSLNSNSSYIGIQGEIDLSSDVSAIYQLEAEADADAAINAVNASDETIFAPDKKALLPR